MNFHELSYLNFFPLNIKRILWSKTKRKFFLSAFLAFTHGELSSYKDFQIRMFFENKKKMKIIKFKHFCVIFVFNILSTGDLYEIAIFPMCIVNGYGQLIIILSKTSFFKENPYLSCFVKDNSIIIIFCSSLR